MTFNFAFWLSLILAAAGCTGLIYGFVNSKNLRKWRKARPKGINWDEPIGEVTSMDLTETGLLIKGRFYDGPVPTDQEVLDHIFGKKSSPAVDKIIEELNGTLPPPSESCRGAR